MPLVPTCPIPIPGPPAEAHRHADRGARGKRGLVLQVLPSGRKRWTVRYRTGGRSGASGSANIPRSVWPRRATPPRPPAPPFAREAIPRGTASRQAAPTDTVAALITEYIAKHVRVKQRGRVEEERILNVEILPRWNDRSVRDRRSTMYSSAPARRCAIGRKRHPHGLLASSRSSSAATICGARPRQRWRKRACRVSISRPF